MSGSENLLHGLLLLCYASIITYYTLNINLIFIDNFITNSSPHQRNFYFLKNEDHRKEQLDLTQDEHRAQLQQVLSTPKLLYLWLNKRYRIQDKKCVWGEHVTIIKKKGINLIAQGRV